VSFPEIFTPTIRWDQKMELLSLRAQMIRGLKKFVQGVGLAIQSLQSLSHNEFLDDRKWKKR
jgi:hypothetical protein